jgi:phage capsid family|nr:MAG TPA: major capsid protein [Caudoviricetes sp.]DAX27221.1 MAG TPA: major capsid protein [Caudoviricetes sp.]
MNITQKIAKAFNAEAGNSKLVHLNTQQADLFIDYIQDESVLLKKVRKVKMNTPIKEIAKVNIGEEVLYPAGRSGTKFTGKAVESGTDSIQLKSKKMRAKVVILDDELEDNIEGPAFKEHLMRMLAKRAGNQLEKTALYGRYIGDTTATPNVISTLNQVDGFLAKAGVIVDASDTNVFDKRSIDLGKLKKLRKSFKNQYRSGLEIFMSDGLKLDYLEKYQALAGYNTVNQAGYAGKNFIDIPLLREDRPVVKVGGASTTLASANTAGQKTITVASANNIDIGDELVIGIGTALEWVGSVASKSGTTITFDTPVPYTYTGNEKVYECLTDGTDVIMTDPNNLIWGIQRDFTLEMDRDADLEANIFYLSIRTDFQVENSEALGVLTNVQSL